jgi:hypothetical protein
MHRKFLCPGCNRPVAVSVTPAGHEVRCGQCGRVMQVPEDTAPASSQEYGLYAARPASHKLATGHTTDTPGPRGKFNAGGVLPGFVASSICTYGFVLGSRYPNSSPVVGLLSFGVQVIVWGAYAGAVSASIDVLTRYWRYRRSVWVTLLSNLTAIAAACAVWGLAAVAVAHGLVTGGEGVVDRFLWCGGTLLAAYVAYMAPGFLIGMACRDGDAHTGPSGASVGGRPIRRHRLSIQGSRRGPQGPN